MKNPREVALKGLINLRRSGQWPDLYLKQERGSLSGDDMAFCANILYGTIENIRLIDFYISKYSSIKLGKIMPQVLDCLRLAVYQIAYLTKVPHSAAINEGVKLVKKYGSSQAVGFSNGVLRSISRASHQLPKPSSANMVEYLGITYSQPDWFVGEMLARLGQEGATALLAANNEQGVMTARVNTLKTTTVELVATLEKEGIAAEKSTTVPGLVTFQKGFNPLSSKAFEQGLYYIQDTAAQLSVVVLDPKRGSTVLDMCAAPGGKSLMAAMLMKNEGSIHAFDIHDHKMEIIRGNAKKYGITIIEAQVLDSSLPVEKFHNMADYIICDVPCSGMGIMRKKPDIRFKRIEELGDLPRIQGSILAVSASCLKVGGTMVYSTCTVRKKENEDVVVDFLAKHKDFELVPFELPIEADSRCGMVTLYPHLQNTDGFFIAKLRKKI